MSKLRISGDSSGYVDLEAPATAGTTTIALEQIPLKNAANVFTSGQNITVPGNGGLTVQAGTNGSASLRLKNDATDWDINCQTTDNFAIYNHTTGGNRLGITPAGIVTMPNQPSFMAMGTSATPTSGQYWPWGSIVFNEGSCFSLATGRFTAPVAGKYMLFATFIGANVDEVFRYYTRKNGSGYPTGDTQIRLDLTATGSNYGYGTSAIIMDMAAGDYASIYFLSSGTASHPSGTNTTSGHEIFSGFLIG